jgi:hypothetical protein
MPQIPIMGGAAPPQAQAGPQNHDELLDTLAKYLTEQLTQQVPQAPTPPQMGGLPGVKAAAAALNPQLSQQIHQTHYGPDIARYQQQQQAFETAMSGRDRAASMATQLAGRDISGQYGMMRPPATRGQIRSVRLDDGSLAYQEMLPDGQGGFTPGEILAPAPNPAAMLPTTEGFIPTNRQTGQPMSGYVQKPGGGGAALPAPPPGIVSDISAGTATLQGLDTLRQAYKDIRAKTQGQGTLEKIGKGFVGGTRYGGAFESTRDYAEYKSSVRQALNAYIKSVTGAQFSVAELQRYEAQFPEPWDDESLAETKIQNLSQRAIADMKAKMRAFPAASGAAPQLVSPREGGPSSDLQEWLRKRGVEVKP